MSRESRTFFRDNIDVVQDNKISNINTRYSNLQTPNSSLPDATSPLEDRRDELQPEITTLGENLEARDSEVEVLESELIELMATKRIDMYNPIFYNKNFIDIDTTKSTMIDLTSFLDSVSGDSINVVKSDTNLLGANKTYYIDVTGEFIADSFARALDFEGQPLFRIKEFTRKLSGIEQTSTIDIANPIGLKECLQLVYGGTIANGVDDRFKYTHARTSTIQGSSRQTNGALIRYTGIFTTDSSDNWYTGDNPYYQKGYGLYVPGIENFEIRNLFVVMFELQ